MKVIDLLNKIANGEIGDTKFIYDDTYYHYFDVSGDILEYTDKTYENEGIVANEDFNVLNLNDEIELIEEPKKIEKIDRDSYVITRNNKFVIEDMFNKINEIIDYINKED